MKKRTPLANTVYYVMAGALMFTVGWLVPNQLASTAHVQEANERIAHLELMDQPRVDPYSPIVQAALAESSALDKRRRTRDATLLTLFFAAVFYFGARFYGRVRFADPFLFSLPLALLLWPFAGQSPLFGLLPGLFGAAGVWRRLKSHKAKQGTSTGSGGG